MGWRSLARVASSVERRVRGIPIVATPGCRAPLRWHATTGSIAEREPQAGGERQSDRALLEGRRLAEHLQTAQLGRGCQL